MSVIILIEGDLNDKRIVFETSIPIPKKVQYGQIKDNEIIGLSFKQRGSIKNFYFDKVAITGLGESLKLKAKIINEEEDEDEDKEEEDELKSLPNEDWSNILVPIIDTHYDCYCKTRKVCGCGCDPLHDGW
jgi:hypothetical protein